MGNQGDLSKASPAACFFASFFAPKKEVRDCQGAHSPLILFRGATGRALPCTHHRFAEMPASMQPPLAAAGCRELGGLPLTRFAGAPLCGGEPRIGALRANRGAPSPCGSMLPGVAISPSVTSAQGSQTLEKWKNQKTDSLFKPSVFFVFPFSVLQNQLYTRTGSTRYR